MFNFTHVLDVTTKQRYYIDRAQLEGDEGYDEAPAGGNLYQIDLQPENPDESPILNVDLYIPNQEGTPQISKNLNSSLREPMIDALVEGKTLIVSAEKEN